MPEIKDGNRIRLTGQEMTAHPRYSELLSRAQDETGTIFGASIVEIEVDTVTGRITSEAWNGTDLVSGPAIEPER